MKKLLFLLLILTACSTDYTDNNSKCWKFTIRTTITYTSYSNGSTDYYTNYDYRCGLTDKQAEKVADGMKIDTYIGSGTYEYHLIKDVDYEVDSTFNTL